MHVHVPSTRVHGPAVNGATASCSPPSRAERGAPRRGPGAVNQPRLLRKPGCSVCRAPPSARPSSPGHRTDRSLPIVDHFVWSRTWPRISPRWKTATAPPTRASTRSPTPRAARCCAAASACADLAAGAAGGRARPGRLRQHRAAARRARLRQRAGVDRRRRHRARGLRGAGDRPVGRAGRPVGREPRVQVRCQQHRGRAGSADRHAPRRHPLLSRRTAAAGPAGDEPRVRRRRPAARRRHEDLDAREGAQGAGRARRVGDRGARAGTVAGRWCARRRGRAASPPTRR